MTLPEKAGLLFHDMIGMGPGGELAVWMVIVICALVVDDERSVSILAIPALRRRPRMSCRMLRSSCSSFV